MKIAWAVIAAALLATPARADNLGARDTATVGGSGEWQAGIFNPLRWTLIDRKLELETHPLVLTFAPNALLRLAHGHLGAFRVTGEYGASLPTGGMRLLQGRLFPTYDEGGGSIGLFLVPRAGLIATRGADTLRTITALVDAAVGIPLGADDITPLGAPAPLELLFAPVTTGFRIRAGGIVDQPLGRHLRARLYGDLYLHGATPSHVTLRAGLGLDIRLSRRSRLTLGAVYYNHDQHEIDLDTGDRVRSHDLYPTVDLIYWSR